MSHVEEEEEEVCVMVSSAFSCKVGWYCSRGPVMVLAINYVNL